MIRITKQQERWANQDIAEKREKYSRRIQQAVLAQQDAQRAQRAAEERADQAELAAKRAYIECMSCAHAIRCCALFLTYGAGALSINNYLSLGFKQVATCSNVFCSNVY